jgi:hypothetical protein
MLFGDSSSYESLDQVRKWLQCCQKNHNCSNRLTSALPSRLIDVVSFGDTGHSGDVKLIDEAHHLVPAEYVALSHCWGGKIPECVTTRETLHTRTQYIPYNLLPRTFRDAVKYTRDLGIRYLWIDSICVVQDDESDWRHEAAQMEKIYGNSTVILAAVHAANWDDGLFWTSP